MKGAKHPRRAQDTQGPSCKQSRCGGLSRSKPNFPAHVLYSAHRMKDVLLQSYGNFIVSFHSFSLDDYSFYIAAIELL